LTVDFVSDSYFVGILLVTAIIAGITTIFAIEVAILAKSDAVVSLAETTIFLTVTIPL